MVKEKLFYEKNKRYPLDNMSRRERAFQMKQTINITISKFEIV